MTSPVILIGGTHGEDDGWWKPSSSFGQGLAAAGLEIADPMEPFEWSNDVDGLLVQGLFGRKHRDWIAAGHALMWYAHYKVPPRSDGEPRRVSIVAHSHAGQVALYAAYYGLLIDRLITVATPVRRDMAHVISGARATIRFWAHLHGDARDWWQVLGGRTLERRMTLADQNVYEPAGHTDLLNPNLWTDRRWWDLLK
jgi:hypothetical protein